MQFSDLQNAVLQRIQQAGVNWTGSPTNTASNYAPPYAVALMLNEGYNDFLSRTMEFSLCALRVSVSTITIAPSATAQTVSLNPIPAFGSLVNPAALKVFEFVYVPARAQAHKIDFVSTAYFRSYTDHYQAILGATAAWPDIVTQQFGQRQVAVYPAFATAGDTVILTICPDPQGSPASCTCANGGIMVNPTDQPLFPAQFHKLLVDYAVAELLDMSDRVPQAQFALQKYEKGIADALDFGASYGEGMAEQTIISVWGD